MADYFSRLNELAGTMGKSATKSLTGASTKADAMIQSKADAGDFTSQAKESQSKKCEDILKNDQDQRTGEYDRCVEKEIEAKDKSIEQEKENAKEDENEENEKENSSFLGSVFGETNLRTQIRNILMEDIEDSEILGEPDLSAEEERDYDDAEVDEINTIATGGVSGHMASGLEYDPEKPDYDRYKINKN